MFTSAPCTPGAVCSAARPHGEDPLRRHTGEATVSNAGLKHTRTTLMGMNTRAGRAGARPGAPEALRPRARPVEGAGCLRPRAPRTPAHRRQLCPHPLCPRWRTSPRPRGRLSSEPPVASGHYPPAGTGAGRVPPGAGPHSRRRGQRRPWSRPPAPPPIVGRHTLFGAPAPGA